MENTHKSHALIFKALCDENRLAILEQLREGEKCACELIEKTKVAQSALSYHMKILCEANIVQSRQEGKWTYYSLHEAGSKAASTLLIALTTPNGSAPQAQKADAVLPQRNAAVPVTVQKDTAPAPAPAPVRERNEVSWWLD